MTLSPMPVLAVGSSHAKRKQRRLGRWVIVMALLLTAGVVVVELNPRGRSSRHAAVSVPANLPQVVGKRIVFSAAYAEHIGLQSTELSRKTVIPAISVVGTVTFDPWHVASIGARLGGVVRDVYRFEGAKVKAGEALAAIDSPELGQAQAAVTVLEAEYGAAELHRAREQGLAERQLTTPRDVEESNAAAEHSEALLGAARQRVNSLAGRGAAASHRKLGVHVLSSPLSGTVIERHVTQGQLVDANHLAFLVANLDHLWVELSVYERSLPSIRRGDLVEIHAGTTSGTDVVHGKVAQVSPFLDAETRGAAIRVQLDNREHKFMPGQSVSATIRAAGAAQQDTPTVPSGAVIHVDGKPSIFVADSPTSVIVTSVELGETNGQEVQIKGGLEPSARVVVRGTAELRNQLFR
jgi:membrane fusion protein, heavy metal efflux system